jgi:hypothetical protein
MPTQVHDRVGALDGARNAFRPAEVGGDELGLAEPAARFQEPCAARIARDDADPRAALQQFRDDIPPQESAAAEHRDQPCHHLVPSDRAVPQAPSGRGGAGPMPQGDGR